MSAGDDDRERAEWHRRFAVETFNATWDLIDNQSRTPDDNLEMLLAALASRWHWGRIGGPEQIATGDWQVAHVASLLGFADLALTVASRHFAIAEEERWSGWRLASAYEGLARAAATAGDFEARRRYVAMAEAALDSEPDEEERIIIAEQLATVPEA